MPPLARRTPGGRRSIEARDTHRKKSGGGCSTTRARPLRIACPRRGGRSARDGGGGRRVVEDEPWGRPRARRLGRGRRDASSAFGLGDLGLHNPSYRTLCIPPSGRISPTSSPREPPARRCDRDTVPANRSPLRPETFRRPLPPARPGSAPRDRRRGAPSQTQAPAGVPG